MRIKEGRYYKTRNGEKVGPATKTPHERYDYNVGGNHYYADGRHAYSDGDKTIIFEFPEEGPVRTVTRREIVPGVYDGVLVGEVVEGRVFVRTGLDDQGKRYSAVELRSVIAVLSQLAEALDENADKA